MCGQTQIVFRSTLSRQCKSLKGGTQCMRGSPLHFPFSIFYGIVSDLPVECEKSIFWMHFYLSFTRGRGQGKSSALSWQMYLTIFGWHCQLLTVPELKPTPSSIWDLSHIIVTKHSGVLCGLMTSESCHCDFGYSQIVGTHRALSNNAGPEHCPIPPARGPHPPQLSPPPLG